MYFVAQLYMDTWFLNRNRWCSSLRNVDITPVDLYSFLTFNCYGNHLMIRVLTMQTLIFRPIFSDPTPIEVFECPL